MDTLDHDPTLPVATAESAAGGAKRSREKFIFVVWASTIGAVGVGLLLLVAFYNRYPTVFADTGSYLWTGAFFVAFFPYRAPGYSLFTRLSSLGASAWFTVAAQAIIVVWLLRETCTHFIGGDRRFREISLLATVCLLTLLTSLPWLASMLMPDVFAGDLFLSAFLLAFTTGFSLPRKVSLAALMTISVIAHTSLLPIAGLFVASVIVLQFARRQPLPLARVQAARAAAWLLLPIVVAGLGTATLNREMGLGFKLTPSRDPVVLARLFGDGLAGDFLRDNCARHAFISCRYLSNLPKTNEDFLFRHPLLQELAGHDDEVQEIVRGTLRAYPMQFAGDSMKDSVRQLLSLRTDEVFRSHGSIDWSASAVKKIFPGDFQAFSTSRQSRGLMLPLAVVASKIDIAIFWLSLGGCVMFARTARFKQANEFFYAVIAFLAINAFVNATLAGVFDRYQSRVEWLVPLCLCMYLSCMARAQRGASAESAPVPIR